MRVAGRRVRPGRAFAALAVVVLHAVVIRSLRLSGPPLPVPPAIAPIAVSLLTPLTAAAAVRPRRGAPGKTLRASRVSTRRRRAVRSLITEPVTARHLRKTPARARIDWLQAMHTEAQSFDSRAERPPQVTFGFPRMPPHAPPHHPFGWDYAATHRIEVRPGGTIMNLSDRCAIAFIPFPIPFCRIGAIPVNGNLFKHMSDPRNPVLGSLP